MADTDFNDCLQLQLSEVEMLQSMFPSKDEFSLDDPSVLSDVQRCINGEVTEVPHQISFTIKIHSDDSKCDVEILCQIPVAYPNELPNVFARSDALARNPQKRLNDDLHEHIMGLERGELCIGEAVQWVQKNIAIYVTQSSGISEPNREALTKTNCKKLKADADTFSRLWIHSHHIYSKIKRKDILELGSSGSLTGFSLPGKPGIICLEGPKDEVEELWARIRRWNWKKISCKHREDTLLKNGETKRTFDDLRCFTGFEEKVFDVRGGPGREYHMDLGLFYKFLEERHCGSVFKILLGVDGKISEK